MKNMVRAIVCDEKKFIYIQIPKAACCSFKDACAEIMSVPLQSEQHILWRKGRLPEIDLNAPEYEDYFKFAFVRNPFARIVSGYYSKFSIKTEYSEKVAALVGQREKGLPRLTEPIREWAGHDDVSFDEFVRYLHETTDDQKLNMHWRPQLSLLGGEENKNKIDFIGHIESIEKDWKIVAEKIGVDVMISHQNKSSHPPYHDCYTDETWQLIKERFKGDIESLGYTESELLHHS